MTVSGPQLKHARIFIVLYLLPFGGICIRSLLLCRYSKVSNHGRKFLDFASGPAIRKLLQKRKCPEDKVSFLSQITFSWFNQIAILGHNRPLQMEDLWELPNRDKSKHLVAKFDRVWATHIASKHFWKIFELSHFYICILEYKSSSLASQTKPNKVTLPINGAQETQALYVSFSVKILVIQNIELQCSILLVIVRFSEISIPLFGAKNIGIAISKIKTSNSEIIFKFSLLQNKNFSILFARVLLLKMNIWWCQ